jgi:hypothetical protein
MRQKYKRKELYVVKFGSGYNRKEKEVVWETGMLEKGKVFGMDLAKICAQSFEHHGRICENEVC